jgi:DNA-binding IclR family transcriptional regulator
VSNSSSRHIFEVLRFVSAAPQPVSVTDVARSLGLATTTAHRALATLEEAQYVSRYQGQPRFVLGPMVQGLFEAFFGRFSLRDLAMPYMRTLALLTGETVSLMVPVGWYSVRIALVRGMKEVIHTGPLGEVRRLSDGLASLAILSTFDDEQVAEILRADSTRRGGRARRELRGALASVRTRGYAAAEVGIRRGYGAVAVPLRGSEPAAIGVLAIEGPVVKLHPESPLPIEWLRIFAEIETQVRANPQRFRNHYAHLSARDIVFTMAAEQRPAG